MTVEHALDTTHASADEEVLQDLLVKTSRTFALAIPLLPQPTRREVTVAYLLFRIADTFEDATVLWSRSERLAALMSFIELLRHPSSGRARLLAAGWLARPPIDHAGYCELLDRSATVLGALDSLDSAAAEAVRRHTIRTAEGMAEFVERTDDDGLLRLRDLADLRGYCYAVAGIVGEMLTELFLLGSRALVPVAPYLEARAASFGEGLQLVNILKDAAGDSAEGRDFLPGDLDRADVFRLARRDLEAAQEYSLAIQRAGGPDGIVAFTALTVALARPTLEGVERQGPGTKISRSDVYHIYDQLTADIASGRPVFHA